MAEDIEELVELPRRVVHQPTPEVSPGGDCGACVLSGLLGMSIEDVYKKLHPKNEVQSFSRYDMIGALSTAKYTLKLVDRYNDNTPHWEVREILLAFGSAGWQQSLEWQAYMHMAFEAGYYGIANVRHDKTGPFTGGPDHWVLLCGMRLRWNERQDNGSRSGQYEVLVSCSSRTTPDLEWVKVGDFLKERGGFNAILVKPK